MKVILTEKVKTLGNIGEIVNVSMGYARNFLFPNKLATVADAGNQRDLDNKKKQLAKKVAAETKTAQELKTKIEQQNLVLTRKVGANGKLFGAITSSELAKELEKLGLSVERRQIHL